MSKGPGNVERRLREVFAREPSGVFTTAALCRRVYGVKEVKKKHRVAVLRALKRLASRSLPWLWRWTAKGERDDAWFDHRAHPSHAADKRVATDKRPRKR
jgi:hypothetical protein